MHVSLSGDDLQESFSIAVAFDDLAVLSRVMGSRIRRIEHLDGAHPTTLAPTAPTVAVGVASAGAQAAPRAAAVNGDGSWAKRPEVVMKGTERLKIKRSLVDKMRRILVDSGQAGIRSEVFTVEAGLEGGRDPLWIAVKKVWIDTGSVKVTGERRAACWRSCAPDWSLVRPWAKRVGVVTPQALAFEFWLTLDEAERYLAESAPKWLTRHAKKPEWTFSPHGDARAPEEVEGAGAIFSSTPPQEEPSVAQLDPFAGQPFAEAFRAWNATSAPPVVFAVTSEPKLRVGKITLNVPHEAEPVQLRSKMIFLDELKAKEAAFLDSARAHLPHYAIRLSMEKLRAAGFLVGPMTAFPGATRTEDYLAVLVAPASREILSIHECGVDAQVLEPIVGTSGGSFQPSAKS